MFVYFQIQVWSFLGSNTFFKDQACLEIRYIKHVKFKTTITFYIQIFALCYQKKIIFCSAWEGNNKLQ